jgi:membrane fusion protein (multidrug efflux system)
MGRALRRGLNYFLVLFVLVVIVAIAAFNLNAFDIRGNMIKTAISAAPRPPVPVTTTTAKKEVWPTRIAAIGTLDAVRGVNISPQVAGRVADILFGSGTTVKAGDVLVRLDSTVEEADLQEAQAQLKLAQLNLARSTEMAERGNTSQAQLDRSRADRDAAQARKERIEANIALKTIRAPFDGRLGIRQVNLGQYLAPGTPIVWLQTIDPVYLNFTVPERDLARLAVGQRVTVRLDGLRADRRDGRITTIDARIDQNSRNISVQATVPNPDGRLVPGMFAEVRVRVGEDKNFVTVPQTSVTYSLYGDSIFVVVPMKGQDGAPAKDGKGTVLLTVERRFVRLGDRRDSDVAVLEGMNEGETVVTAGQVQLNPGVRVVVNNSVGVTPPAERSRP